MGAVRRLQYKERSEVATKSCEDACMIVSSPSETRARSRLLVGDHVAGVDVLDVDDVLVELSRACNGDEHRSA